MRIRPAVTLALCLLVVSTASAAPKSKQSSKQRMPVAGENCESTGESTKRCLVHGDSAELHLNISRAYPVIVTFDETPEFAYDDAYIKGEATQQFVLFKMKQDNLPKGHKLIVRTETMTLTLFFHAVATGSDSQVHVQQADRAERDQVVGERVKQLRVQLEAEHKKRLNQLDARAARLARNHFLDEVFLAGSQIAEPAGEVRARKDFLVLRATKVIRIGRERLLLVTIEERKGDTFSIGNFTTSVSQGATKRTVDADFRCGSMRVRPGKVVSCYLSLGSIAKKHGRTMVSVRVEGADGQRSVHLDGVDIR